MLIEYGWALKSLTYSRIVPVMNVAFGAPTAEEMPFDMRHLRNPITYDCPPSADEQTRRAVKGGLVKTLRSAIAEVLDSDAYLASVPRPPEPVPFTRRPSVSSPGRFAAAGEEIGVRERYPGVSDFVAVEAGPVIWLRLVPQHTQQRVWSVAELAAADAKKQILPINRSGSGFGRFSSDEAFGWYASSGIEPPESVVAAFSTGEVWSFDKYWLAAFRNEKTRAVPPVMPYLQQALDEYASFLDTLGVSRPYMWQVGFEDMKGRRNPTADHRTVGSCLREVVTSEGQYVAGDLSPLTPFWDKVEAACGLRGR